MNEKKNLGTYKCHKMSFKDCILSCKSNLKNTPKNHRSYADWKKSATHWSFHKGFIGPSNKEQFVP
jgi:hypothetical protein